MGSARESPGHRPSQAPSPACPDDSLLDHRPERPLASKVRGTPEGPQCLVPPARLLLRDDGRANSASPVGIPVFSFAAQRSGPFPMPRAGIQRPDGAVGADLGVAAGPCETRHGPDCTGGSQRPGRARPPNRTSQPPAPRTCPNPGFWPGGDSAVSRPAHPTVRGFLAPLVTRTCEPRRLAVEFYVMDSCSTIEPIVLI